MNNSGSPIQTLETNALSRWKIGHPASAPPDRVTRNKRLARPRAWLTLRWANTMNDAYVGLAVWATAVVCFAVVFVRLLTHPTPPPSQRLEAWAKQNAFEIVCAERRFFLKGPFASQRDGAPVYRVHVRDRGEIKEGWVCFYYPLFGREWDEVRWTRVRCA